MMLKDNNFISAVVYLHNDGARAVEFCRTVAAELDANFKQYELVVVDDACTDDTVKQLRTWGREQDAPLIAAAINKAAGCEVRALPYLHWWTFMAWFNSIGDGQLATLLRVRSKLRHGQKLQPWEQDYYRKNKAMVDLRPRLNPAEIAERQRLQRLLAN